MYRIASILFVGAVALVFAPESGPASSTTGCYICVTNDGGNPGCSQQPGGLTMECNSGCGETGCGCTLHGTVCSDCCQTLDDVALDGRPLVQTVPRNVSDFNPPAHGSIIDRSCKSRILRVIYGHDAVEEIESRFSQLSL